MEVIVFITYFAFIFFEVRTIQAEVHPDIGLTLSELISKYGYPVEIHDVVTEDGYIVTMQRIPHGLESNQVNKKPILLMHGMCGSAENFVVSGMINASLAYYLADNGYDVWLGNARGNVHSRKHTSLDPDKDPAFWQFSWHEIGIIDLATSIDYILKMTNKKALNYVGHSQGGTTILVLLSERPEYNSKIKTAALMAPGVFMNHFPLDIVKTISKHHYFLEALSVILNMYEIPPMSSLTRELMKMFCNQGKMFSQACSIIYLLITGNDEEQLSAELVPLIASTNPSSASTKQGIHYTQEIESGHFRQYDHGTKKNMKKYNNTVPPDYDLNNVVAPIALFYGLGDNVASYKDMEYLSKVLPNLAVKHPVQWEKFNHFDFLFAKDAVKLVYKPMIEIFEKYEKD